MSAVNLSPLGKNLSHYKVIKLLNQGGMGEIYLAEDQRLHRTVAIKTLKPAQEATNSTESTENSKTIADALNEARLLAKLNHANIVQIYDIAEQDQQISLVMEYLTGKTLHRYQQEQVCSLTEKLAIITQISKGLTAAHAQGIVHCDLKPNNILIDDHGHVKIVDFGIAKLNNNNNNNANADSAPVDNDSQTYGSQTAMSPEQLGNILPNAQVVTIDFRSDLFALGILAFQLISGRHPFAEAPISIIAADNTATNAVNSTARNILNGIGQNAQDIVPQLPRELVSLLNQLLAHQPENRPQSSQWVTQQFEQITKHLSQQEILAEDTQPITEELAEELSHELAANLSSTDIKTTTNNSGKKIISLSFVLLTALLIAVAIYSDKFFSPELLPTRYVVVLPPTITNTNPDKPIADMQKDLVTATLDDAIRQSIINTKQLRLIPDKEVRGVSKEANGDLATIGAATGASDIITTELTCNNVRCNVTLSRLTVESYNTDDMSAKKISAKKWTVLSQKKWPTQLENYNDINQDAKANLDQTFPTYSDNYLTDKPINPQDYLSYIELYEQTLIQGKSTSENLDKLQGVIDSSPYLYSAYSLYRELALDLYHKTNDSDYIDGIEMVMASAPPEYKYSTFQAIDIFGVKLSLNNIKQAEKQLAVIIERGIDNSTLLELKAILFLISGDYQQAVDLYNSALSLRPSTKLLLNLAYSYYYSNDFNNTIHTLEKIIAITPNKYKANKLLASTYLTTGEFERAINLYEDLLHSTDSKNLGVSNLGLAYYFSGRYLEALSVLESAAKNNPNNAGVLLNLADLKLILGEIEQANVNYKQVILLNKSESSLIAQHTLAQAYVHLGNDNAAIKALNNAKKKAPNDGETAFVAALVYSEIGETTSAIHQVEEALSAGIGAAWFNLPWFNTLCSNPDFRKIMSEAGNLERCQPL